MILKNPKASMLMHIHVYISFLHMCACGERNSLFKHKVDIQKANVNKTMFECMYMCFQISGSTACLFPMHTKYACLNVHMYDRCTYALHTYICICKYNGFRAILLENN